MSQLHIGEIVQKRYRVIDLLGEGGMKRVYLVEDLEGARKWALKMTRDRDEVDASQADIYTQYRKEIAILTGLTHKSLPAIEDRFKIGENYCIVEEFVEGMPLNRFVEENQPSQEEVISWGVKLCEVLHLFHRSRIIFRDIKPENIIITKDQEIKLIDFDIVRQYKEGASRDTEPLGTPGYAAPETYGTAQSSPRSDIYSIGATLHHLLTGVDPQDKPFQFEPIAKYRPDINPDLQGVIEKALSREPEGRFRSVQEMKKELERIRDGKSADSPVQDLSSMLSTLFNFSTVNGTLNMLILFFVIFFCVGALSLLGNLPGKSRVHVHSKKKPSPQPVQAPSPARTGNAAVSRNIFEALQRDSTSDVRYILWKDPSQLRTFDEQGRTPLHAAADLERWEAMKNMLLRRSYVNIKDGWGRTPLHIVAKQGPLEVAEILVTQGAEVKAEDSSRNMPLHCAAMGGNLEVARYLLDNGAPVNAGNGHAQTPLHLAAACHNVRMASLLVEQGADVEARDGAARTPLLVAIEASGMATADFLVEKGADVNAKAVRGVTPLHLAVTRFPEYSSFLERLISKGAAVNARTDYGETPLAIAEKHHLGTPARILRAHGGAR